MESERPISGGGNVTNRTEVIEHATKATAIRLAQLAERNLFHFSHQCNHEIDRAVDRDDEIAIASVGIALCRARAIIRDEIAKHRGHK